MFTAIGRPPTETGLVGWGEGEEGDRVREGEGDEKEEERGRGGVKEGERERRGIQNG